MNRSSMQVNNPGLQELKKMFNKIKIFLIVLGVVGLLLLGIFHVEIPYTINGQGLLLPQKEWNLIQTANGNVVNSLKNNKTQQTQEFISTEFERGDHVTFMLKDQLNSGVPVEKGDSIGALTSHQEMFKLTELRKDLAEQKHLRSINTTGEKPRRTRAALEEWRMAKADLETEQRSFNRSKQLFEMNVIAEQEFEEAQNLLNQKKQRVLITKANYEDLKAGAKEEEVELVEARIEALEKQIELTLDRLDALSIESPLKGFFSTEYSPQATENKVLAKVVDDEKMIFMLPVELTNLSLLEKDLPVSLNSDYLTSPARGKLLHTGRNVQTIDGRQVIFAIFLIENQQRELLPNLKVEGIIHCESVSIPEYLKRLVTTIYTN